MSLEVVIGPMFSGKTSYAIEVAAIYISKNMRVLIVKPTRDTRSIPNHITTHDGISLPCFEISTLNGLTQEFMANYETVIIDEAQFFQGLVPFVEYAVDTLGKFVYLIGLSGDSDRRPFGELLNTIPLANEVINLNGRCACGEPSFFSKRRVSGYPQIAIGGAEMYSGVCRTCYHR